MKRQLLVFLAVCALAAAMVPRNRRHVNYCAPTTPCAWSVYKLSSGNDRDITTTITNSYCQCDPKTSCEIYEDDNIGSFAHRCKAITEN